MKKNVHSPILTFGESGFRGDISVPLHEFPDGSPPFYINSSRPPIILRMTAR